MYTGQVAIISNRATWLSIVYELEDEDTKTTTDLSDPLLTVDIVVTIKDFDGCTRAMASVADGQVTIVGPGFQWRFEDTDLSNLCAGTYGLGVKVTIDGFITDVIDGTIAVLEGN